MVTQSMTTQAATTETLSTQDLPRQEGELSPDNALEGATRRSGVISIPSNGTETTELHEEGSKEEEEVTVKFSAPFSAPAPVNTNTYLRWDAMKKSTEAPKTPINRYEIGPPLTPRPSCRDGCDCAESEYERRRTLPADFGRHRDREPCVHTLTRKAPCSVEARVEELQKVKREVQLKILQCDSLAANTPDDLKSTGELLERLVNQTLVLTREYNNLARWSAFGGLFTRPVSHAGARLSNLFP